MGFLSGDGPGCQTGFLSSSLLFKVGSPRQLTRPPLGFIRHAIYENGRFGFGAHDTTIDGVFRLIYLFGYTLVSFCCCQYRRVAEAYRRGIATGLGRQSLSMVEVKSRLKLEHHFSSAALSFACSSISDVTVRVGQFIMPCGNRRLFGLGIGGTAQRGHKK